MEGTVKIQCKKSAGSKFTDLLYQQDPTRARRDAESVKRGKNGNRNVDNFQLLGDLVKNGYVSNTMRTINISTVCDH